MKILALLALVSLTLSCNKITGYKQQKKILLTEEFDSNDKGWKFGIVKSSGDTLQSDSEDVSRIENGILHLKSEGNSEEVFAELDVTDLKLDAYDNLIVRVELDKPWHFLDQYFGGVISGVTENFRLDIGKKSIVNSDFAPTETKFEGAFEIRRNSSKSGVVVRSAKETIRDTYFYERSIANAGGRALLKFNISRVFSGGSASYTTGEIGIKRIEIYYQ